MKADKKFTLKGTSIALAATLTLATFVGPVQVNAATTSMESTTVLEKNYTVDTNNILLSSNSVFSMDYSDGIEHITLASKDLETADAASEEETEEKADEAKDDAKAQESQEEAAKEDEFTGKAMANVDDFVNIRQEATTESKILGKLRRGDLASVVEKGEVWTKISSGSVEGYVSNEFLVFDADAKALAGTICDRVATVNENAIRLRYEPDLNSKVYDLTGAGNKYKVLNEDAGNGFMEISYNDKSAFIAKEFVSVSWNTSQAISIEEELAAIAAEKAAKEAAAAAAAAAVAASSGQSASVQASNPATAASVSDTTLLAALIYCEAGGESYDAMLAVGAVVMNRVYSSAYPNSIREVIYQRGQFGPTVNGALNKALSNGYSSTAAQAANAALAGQDNTNGAMYFGPAGSTSGVVYGSQVFH
ncbi:SH3 domain-containing protein [Acetitomaculum ruminis DSM 5522]|uniref:SH3 domain-containing protein n=1 Tax=Acetitomaculum ruminis DSM 5522 TaxID=1120918 RepID=A0A1I0X0G9_9FIRM|nr:cell wall hydrolase [Acetitomaculum ruminis]SFA94512.1 SH3 domain-containing protein [Acetitomaculum ruminis DSM 5522]